VWALAHRNGNGEALNGKRVVVVGAGAAGLTAAAGAALAGAHVWTEKAERPMSLQIGCDHRFLMIRQAISRSNYNIYGVAGSALLK
jgi:pyruvate/2-oxoglutarate dehydrogenase complex dihydrolipoamide dehydrogenase (E3) component